MIYFCQQKNRRSLVLQNPTINGIDFLEVCAAGDETGDCGCGKRLLMTLLHDARGVVLDPTQIQITGGAADAQVVVSAVSPGTNDAPMVVTIDLNQTGDFSPYTLRLVANPQTVDPPDGFDPRLSCITFSFKAGCPAIGDCAPDNCCPPGAPTASDINYLAKDYDTFRQVILDRIAVLAPGWTETHPSDIGMALVEALAYAADNLSYQQDAAGTEAYLGTARSRISLRRHARLVDYFLDEGCNARTWVYLQTNLDGFIVPQFTPIYALVPGLPPMVAPSIAFAPVLMQSAGPVFSTLSPITLHAEQNQIQFYTWCDTSCCLTPGSVEATLAGNLTSLQIGTVLIFQEMSGPLTGNTADANVNNRWAVRLTGVRTTNYKGGLLQDPLTDDLVTQVTWDAADALPFPLCISAIINGKLVSGISVALGNIVPADHGIWATGSESLGAVPAPPPAPIVDEDCSCNGDGPVDTPLPRYFPQLANSPLTFAWFYDAGATASSFMNPVPTVSHPRPAPQISAQDNEGAQWAPLDDLLSCGSSTKAFVVEIEYDGTAYLRFGDGEYGAAAEENMAFSALYRVGNGASGNVGAGALAHILVAPLQPGSPPPADAPPIALVTNPLPAAGGRDGETMDHIRQSAPYAFQTQLRAVTEDDYGTMAQTVPGIEQARGTLRWTGSWYTAFVSLEGTTDNLPASAVQSVEQQLNYYRMIGVDLAAESAVIVGLRIEFDICVDDDHFQADVQTAVQQLLVAGTLCNGQPGLLNRDNFVFGQTVYASPLVAAVQNVAGVASVVLSVFQRLDEPWLDGAAQGFLTMGRLEIARCDNNPNRPNFGSVVLKMDGGK